MARDDAFMLAMIHALPDPVVGVDGDGRIRAWNALASTAFGWSEDEAYGARLSELLGVDANLTRRAVHTARTKVGGTLSVTIEAVAVVGSNVVSMLVLRPLKEGTAADSVKKLVEDLPPRLKQTLDGLCEGLAEKEIAGRLGLSQHTVHGYVKTLYRRFAVQTRGSLVARVVLCLQSADVAQHGKRP